jgi:ribosomal protein S21
VTVNVSVRARPHENPERLIRRFIKKVKRDGVLEKYRERCSYHVKKKLKQKKARREKERLERKLNKRK